jgi:t-SNARE complex subunit (syntaxin)
MSPTVDPSQTQDAQLALREEYYRPRDRKNVLTTRADLAGLLENIAGELRKTPEPTDAGSTTHALVEDTQETLAHAEALLAAVDRKLAAMTRAARAAYAQQVGPGGES